MLVRDLQCLLAALYGIDIGADVRDYLVTDSGALAPWSAAVRDTAEQLFIEQGDGEVGLALYLEQALLDRLAADDPRRGLDGGNLADFCLALEGVSHFNYVAWNAARDTAVTLLELEMQAEVDKYACARVLLGAQATPAVEASLLDSLFDDPVFDPVLEPSALARYQDANRLAGRYCRCLQARYPAGAPPEAMVRELRAFYRWSQPAKVSHIRSALLS
ncbi:MAG: hypothetical protein IT486_12800 [Gammaproteobacteria bacterium]|nr:hypothetical protein [Gammaproteobacteria bacterium]